MKKILVLFFLCLKMQAMNVITQKERTLFNILRMIKPTPEYPKCPFARKQRSPEIKRRCANTKTAEGILGIKYVSAYKAFCHSSSSNTTNPENFYNMLSPDEKEKLLQRIH